MPPADPRTDEELIEAARRGDHEAFAALYQRHRDWVVALAYGFARDREIALDTLQETFAYVLRKLPTLRLTARMTTFLYPVVKHTAIGLRRKRGTVADPEGVPEREPVALPAPEADAQAVSLAVDALPDAQREVVLMRYVAQMSLAEIAAALGKPVGTVKSNLHHAVTNLESRLPADCRSPAACCEA